MGRELDWLEMIRKKEENQASATVVKIKEKELEDFLKGGELEDPQNSINQPEAEEEKQRSITVVKITEKELDDFLNQEDSPIESEPEDPQESISQTKVKEEKTKSLGDIESSWRVKTQPEMNKNEKKTGSFCSVCGGAILERSYIPFIGNADIYGPGGGNQATEASRQVDGYHCRVCGLEYHFPPPKDVFKAKAEN